LAGHSGDSDGLLATITVPGSLDNPVLTECEILERIRKFERQMDVNG
jgi:hypothetical protein